MATPPRSTSPLVLHLNGAPGVGKSTLAGLWAERHPGTLLLDVDVLRTWVSGWREEFGATGAAVRPAALALLSAYVANGGSVVLPQLLADPAELARFREAAEGAGGTWVEVVLEADDAAARFASRAVDRPHLEAVHRLVADDPDHLDRYADRLRALADTIPGAVRLRTVDGDIEAAYAALVRVVRAA
jgi:predicted kinase